MKYYFQFTLLSYAFYYLAITLEATLKRFPNTWYEKYVPNTGGLLTVLTNLCDLNQWLFTKSCMFDPNQIVQPITARQNYHEQRN